MTVDKNQGLMLIKPKLDNNDQMHVLVSHMVQINYKFKTLLLHYKLNKKGRIIQVMSNLSSFNSKNLKANKTDSL